MATGLRRIDNDTRSVRVKDIYYEGISYAHDTFATATPANTNEATLLTLAAGEELIDSEVNCTNKSASEVTVRVGVGTGVSPSAYLAYDLPILANLYVRIKIPGLGSLNKIFIRAVQPITFIFQYQGTKRQQLREIIMAKVRFPNVDSMNRVSSYITLSSSGFPDPNNSQDGATLHFIDAQFDSHYVQYQNMWILDLDRSRGYDVRP